MKCIDSINFFWKKTPKLKLNPGYSKERVKQMKEVSAFVESGKKPFGLWTSYSVSIFDFLILD